LLIAKKTKPRPNKVHSPPRIAPACPKSESLQNEKVRKKKGETLDGEKEKETQN
jgi:hypothetical protein